MERDGAACAAALRGGAYRRRGEVRPFMEHSRECAQAERFAPRGAIAAASEGAPQLRAAEAFIAQAASVLLHLPAPEGLPHAQDVLPPGLRAFA